MTPLHLHSRWRQKIILCWGTALPLYISVHLLLCAGFSSADQIAKIHLLKSNPDKDWVLNNSAVWVHCITKYLFKPYFSFSLLCLYTCAPRGFRCPVTQKTHFKSCWIFLPPFLKHCVCSMLSAAANRCTSTTKRHCSSSFERKCSHRQLGDMSTFAKRNIHQTHISLSFQLSILWVRHLVLSGCLCINTLFSRLKWSQGCLQRLCRARLVFSIWGEKIMHKLRILSLMLCNTTNRTFFWDNPYISLLFRLLSSSSNVMQKKKRMGKILSVRVSFRNGLFFFFSGHPQSGFNVSNFSVF